MRKGTRRVTIAILLDAAAIAGACQVLWAHTEHGWRKQRPRRLQKRLARMLGELGRSVEVVRDVSRGTMHAYAIGTPDPAGRYLEFGTARRPASPWLWPAFRARLPGIKHRLRKLAAAASKTPTLEA